MGLFAYHFKYTPNQVDDLTVYDFLSLVGFIDSLEDQMKKVSQAK